MSRILQRGGIKTTSKNLRLNSATKKVNYVSKEDASKIHANEIGEDFMEFWVTIRCLIQ